MSEQQSDTARADGPRFTRISSKMLRTRLPILGYIKVGQRRAAQRGGFIPQKLSHFRVTHRAREDGGLKNFQIDQGVHGKVGREPTELDIRFLFSEPHENWQTRFLAYEGRTRRCEGDGEKAYDHVLGQEIPCTCPLLKQHTGPYDGPPRPSGARCKPTGVLTVMLEAADGYGGFHVFTTSAWETIAVITEALDTFRAQFGRLDWIPFKLVAYPTTDTWDDNGVTKQTTSLKVAVVLRGSMNTALQIAAGEQEQRKQFMALVGERYTPEEHAAHLRETMAEDFDSDEAWTVPGEAVEEIGEEDEADFEVVNEQEELLRRAMQIAGMETEKINHALTKYSDRLTELGEYIEREKPDAYAQAKRQLEIEAEAAAFVPDDVEEEAGEEPAAGSPASSEAPDPAMPDGDVVTAEPVENETEPVAALDLFGE